MHPLSLNLAWISPPELGCTDKAEHHKVKAWQTFPELVIQSIQLQLSGKTFLEKVVLELSTVGKSESSPTVRGKSGTLRQGTDRYKGVHVSKHEVCELQEM